MPLPQELEYLNLAVNNITRIQNLQRCEALQKLDLTINFVDKAGLLTVDSLKHNINLRELVLMGNPCAEWSGYRQYVIAKLPQLQKLVRRASGCVCLHQPVALAQTTLRSHTRSEHIAAQQVLPQLDHTHAHAHMYTYRTHVKARTHIHTYTCTYTCKHIHVRIVAYICSHARTHTHVHVHTHCRTAQTSSGQSALQHSKCCLSLRRG